MSVDWTPARHLAKDLPNADPEGHLYVNLGILGKRRVRGYVFAHAHGPVKLRVETWRQMRARVRAERDEALA